MLYTTGTVLKLSLGVDLPSPLRLDMSEELHVVDYADVEVFVGAN